MSESFDLVVVGSGPGGHAVAEQSARLGAKVAVIEKKEWGGVCTNEGCIPTKALLACSHAYSELRKIKRLGIQAEGSFDFAAVKRHQNQIVRVSSLGVQKSLREAGVRLVQGHAKILSPNEIKVASSQEECLFTAKNVVIACGSIPSFPPGIHPAGRILSSGEFLAMNRLPGSVLILGGGGIGLEFASFLSGLGCRATIIELMDQVLPYEDGEAARFIQKELEKSGIEIITSARAEKITDTGDCVRIEISRGGEARLLEAELALICSGRKPALNREELSNLGIIFSEKGIRVDARQQTSTEGVFAVGDVTGSPLLAHRAAQQGKALASALFGDGSVIYDENCVPSVSYTRPGLARVGLTENAARSMGVSFEVKRSDFGANILARAELKGNGFFKALFSKDRLIGATLVCEGAAELIAGMGLALAAGLGPSDLKKWIIAHPTLSETLDLWH
jgi:dihydrolipoamide dehydrogenase